MNLEIKKKVYKKKKINSFYMSLWFLFISIVLAWILYFYNMNLIDQNRELDNNIAIKESSINELEKDSKIMTSSLYNNNIYTIQKLEDQSRISLYINHLMELSRKYNIDFRGFKYFNWNLRTQAIATSDWYWLNYKKVSRFIKEYRENKDLSSLFDLDLVKNVTAKDKGVLNEFSINLNLKNNISKILEISKEKKLQLEKNRKIEEEKRREEFNRRKEALLKKTLDKNINFSWSLTE